MFTGCAPDGVCAPMVCPNPGGVTGRSLGRCNTAAFTCGGSLAAVVVFAVLVLLLVELLADCP